LTIIQPKYKNGTNDGTPESHARNAAENDDIRTNRKKMGNQAEMKAEMDLHREKLAATMKASKEKREDMRDDCLGYMEACLDSKEPTPLEIELPAVGTSGALKEQYGD
jgi:hypothetical protein